MKPINIHVVVSETTIEYFYYLIANSRALADKPQRLFFYCYALDEKTYKQFKSYESVIQVMPIYQYHWAYRKKTWDDWKIYLKFLFTGVPRLRGSNGHAAGLTGFKKTVAQLAGHHIIADVDTVLLQQHWDIVLCDLLQRYDLVGAPYEPIGGFSTGSGKVQTYKGFPTAVWVALKEGHSWHEVDWWPAKEKNILIKTKEDAQLYQLPMDYELVRDVGWTLCSFCHKHQMRALAFSHVKPSSGLAKIIQTGTDYNEEYQLDGSAFVGHQRGSSRNPFRQTELSSNFFNTVEQAIGVPPSVI